VHSLGTKPVTEMTDSLHVTPAAFSTGLLGVIRVAVGGLDLRDSWAWDDNSEGGLAG
jgi:hypothetical protein